MTAFPNFWNPWNNWNCWNHWNRLRFMVETARSSEERSG